MSATAALSICCFVHGGLLIHCSFLHSKHTVFRMLAAEFLCIVGKVLYLGPTLEIFNWSVLIVQMPKF